MNINIKNLWSIVTGGAIGIGKELAKTLAKNGSNVVITYRNSSKEANKLKDNLEEKYNIKALAVKLDSSDDEAVKVFFDNFANKNIYFSILINNAGDYLYKNILDIDYKEWRYIIKNNLDATFIMTYNFLKFKEKLIWGRIINIGYANSGTSKSTPNITPYYIAKSGIYQLSISLSKEIIKNNITINVISPGVMENSINVGKKINIHRYGKLSELSSIMLYLLSKDSDYCTGNQINISGGFAY